MRKLFSIKYSTLLWAAVISQSAFTQEKYDLQRCIQTGLEKNYGILISRNNQQISDNNATPGNAGFLPAVDISSSFGGTLRDKTSYPASGSSLKNNGVSDTGLDAKIDLNWTIFDGFSMFSSYSRLKELQKSGELRTRMEIENFIAGITGEYYNYVQENIRFNNLKSAVNLSRERLRIVEANYNIGSMSRLDFQQAKVDFNADSSRLIKQQEVLFASQISLRRMMADTLLSEPFLPADTAISFFPLFSKDELYNELQRSNTTLLLAEKEKNISLYDLKILQGKNLPYLRANAGYGYSTNRYGASTTLRQDYLGWNYGLTLGMNLFNGGNRGREQRNARLNYESKILDTEELKLSVKSEFANRWMAYRNNLELTNLERENIESAQQNYEIAIDRYKLGNLSGIELREAQNSLLEAEERLVQAQFNTKLCEISLLQISGKITGIMSQK